MKFFNFFFILPKNIIGRFLDRYIIFSPSAHRIHHSIERKQYGKNFGNTFNYWDLLFGSSKPHTVVKDLGLERNRYNKVGVFKDTLRGFVEFFKYLKFDTKAIFQSK